MSDLITVNMIPASFQFVSDSQDVNAIKESFESAVQREMASDYDSFFVLVGEGEYIAVYGMCGIIPYNSKFVRRIL